ncbi:MAG TPA: hypothetical protein VGT07_13240 [Steroidobacteraceae bacterium]|nr:hypothetical protein [Steroidobacteraceae bacterium]
MSLDEDDALPLDIAPEVRNAERIVEIDAELARLKKSLPPVRVRSDSDRAYWTGEEVRSRILARMKALQSERYYLDGTVRGPGDF